MFRGVGTFLGFALEDFGQEFPSVQREAIACIVGNVSAFGVIAGGIREKIKENIITNSAKSFMHP
ncbi:hypothetical protein FACS18942_03280 [Planctomycetales bacterium]|nr:hypothetical protein FACS18942_03280 [Planctomycetales bacterium]